MSDRYPREWNGIKHPDHDLIVTSKDRVGQVWEDVDGWVFFVVGSPRVTAYEMDGRPYQLVHPVLVMTSEGEIDDWPMFETLDRPLELRHNRLA